MIRLISMLAIEANDEWLVGRAYISQKSMKLVDATPGQADSLEQQHRQEASELIAA